MKNIILLIACTTLLLVSCQQDDFLNEIPESQQIKIEPTKDITGQELYEQQRQQLGVNSLSLSSQAAQSILGLF